MFGKFKKTISNHWRGGHHANAEEKSNERNKNKMKIFFQLNFDALDRNMK